MDLSTNQKWTKVLIVVAIQVLDSVFVQVDALEILLLRSAMLKANQVEETVGEGEMIRIGGLMGAPVR